MSLLPAVIFDLDGTLWDTSEVCALAWNQALSNLGLNLGPITAGDIGSIMGLTHDQIFPRLFPQLEADLRERLSQECYLQEFEFIERLGGRLYPGVRDGLDRLSARMPLYIVSNCQQGYVEQFFRATALSGCFSDFECHGNTGLSKGENLRLLRQRHGLRQALYVGDTAGDGAAAAQADLPFVFVEYGFGQCDQEAMRFAEFSHLVDWLLGDVACS